jgi:hypothetical protein
MPKEMKNFPSRTGTSIKRRLARRRGRQKMSLSQAPSYSFTCENAFLIRASEMARQRAELRERIIDTLFIGSVLSPLHTGKQFRRVLLISSKGLYYC